MRIRINEPRQRVRIKAKTGRPSKYNPAFVKIAERAFNSGMTEQEVAVLFDISTATFQNWKRQYPALLEVCNTKDEIGIKRAENSLYSIANGWISEREIVDKKTGEVKIERRRLPPELQAISFYLGNRAHHKWKSITRNEVVGATDAPPIRLIREGMTLEEAAELYRQTLQGNYTPPKLIEGQLVEATTKDDNSS
jgi:hypothetical protein